jgi:hypothetical protein
VTPLCGESIGQLCRWTQTDTDLQLDVLPARKPVVLLALPRVTAVSSCPAEDELQARRRPHTIACCLTLHCCQVICTPCHSWSSAHHDSLPALPCRKFPWDKQQLLIQLKYDHDTVLLNTTSTLVPSASLCAPPRCLTLITTSGPAG